MELISRLLFSLARLAALAHSGFAQVEATPLTELLRAVLGELLTADLAGAAEQAFGAGGSAVGRRAALGQLARGLERAARDPAGYQRMEMLAHTVEALLLADGVARGRALGATRLQLGEPALFHALRLLRLSTADAPPTLLVGALGAADAAVEIPLRLAAPLDRLALRYEAHGAAPRWQTDLWVRVPPDPNKRRLEDWQPGALERAGRIELYRQRLPGHEPIALIANEPIAFPHDLNAGQITLELQDRTGQLAALRTTIRDKFQHSLAVVERVVAHGRSFP